ncbi:Metal tolerance protein B [Heracleum sosnowskyi]|uniref:Metal tolerance protein B n=1 Tax=Heracleum sosnowskyi TaxID=360622 RepID=A0AAD8M2J9_9APIA|nr:Metal tolerance protein B [Heracleum sosnowskyi]
MGFNFQYLDCKQMELEILPAAEEHQLKVNESPKGSGEMNVSSKAPTLSCSVCSFLTAEFSLSDAEERSKNGIKLFGLIFFYLIVMVVEIVGGLEANSLAVLTDAAHLLSDIAGFSISLFTVWASGWKATSQQSFGFHRLEVLGAFLSVELIWVISGTLIYAAVERMFHKNEEVNGKLMFVVASFGCFVNLVMVLWLGHGHDHGHGHHSHDHGHSQSHHHGHTCAECTEEEFKSLVPSSPVKKGKVNINIEGAYLHVITDLIQTIGVMIAGLIIWAKPDWLVVDLVCTLIFSVVALSTTKPMLTNICSIFLESTPGEINVDRLQNDLKCMEGVKDVHDMHVWSITLGKNVLACHVIVETGVSLNKCIHKLTDYCQTVYGIHHVTIQIEEG